MGLQPPGFSYEVQICFWTTSQHHRTGFGSNPRFCAPANTANFYRGSCAGDRVPCSVPLTCPCSPVSPAGKHMQGCKQLPGCTIQMTTVAPKVKHSRSQADTYRASSSQDEQDLRLGKAGQQAGRLHVCEPAEPAAAQHASIRTYC